jgi:hypothetical protein
MEFIISICYKSFTSIVLLTTEFSYGKSVTIIIIIIVPILKWENQKLEKLNNFLKVNIY